MKRNLVQAFLIVLVLGAMAPHALAARHDGDAAIRKEAQAFFDKVAAMFDQKDAEAAMRICVPGATLRYSNGLETTIEEWVASAVKEFTTLASMKSKFKVEKVTTAEDTRVVTYVETHDYVLAAEKGHKYRSVSRWSVTLVKTPQGWKAAHFVEFTEKTTRDGKIIKPKCAPETT